jgi:O-methyltransferase
MRERPWLARWLRTGGSSAVVAGPDLLLESAGEEDRAIVTEALAHSMTGAARLLGLVDAVRYCVARRIPGAFVECGVWRGGSALAVILTLQALGVDDRDVYLYDTFEGMTEPTEHDVSDRDGSALTAWQEAVRGGRRPWEGMFGSDVFGEEQVRSLLTATGYPAAHLRLIRGSVEATIPDQAPEEIALLRLDTDWYESTRHELIHLFPRLATGGALIIDDYGHWQGARRAVDEYFSSVHPPLLLSRIDYTGRVAVKQ